MTDFAAARRAMVDSQVRPNNVSDTRILTAMLELPRERFVAAGRAGLAYLDRDVPAAGTDAARPTRFLLQPMVLARLLQAADIRATDRILDVACGSGYSSAILARLGKSVVALDDERAVAARAEELLKETGAANVTVACGALEAGWQTKAPFDVILINGMVQTIPAPLFAQLFDNGRLVAILQDGPLGKAMLYRSVRGEVSGRAVFEATGPLLAASGFRKQPEFVF